MDDLALFLGDDQEDEGDSESLDASPGRRLLVGEIVIECPVVIEFVGGATLPEPSQNDWVFSQMTEAIRQA